MTKHFPEEAYNDEAPVVISRRWIANVGDAFLDITDKLAQRISVLENGKVDPGDKPRKMHFEFEEKL